MKSKTLVCLTLLAVATLLIPAAQAQIFSVIHTFTGIGGDGANPSAGVILRAGVLYGTTYQGGLGGVNGRGTVYQMTHVGSNWNYKPIFLFPANGSGGANPSARVVFGPDLRLYGTTTAGGSFQKGVVFFLTAPISICRTLVCLWKEKVIYHFQGPPDGAEPMGDLTWDPDGNIYGTTVGGGPTQDEWGTAYELHSGNSWTEEVLHNFTRFGGVNPNAGLVYSGGKLFGTSPQGGLSGNGEIFELVFGFNWMENHLHDFANQGDGSNAVGGLIMDASGSFYGATAGGGSGGGGVVYKEQFSGGTWTFLPIYSFAPYPGCGPAASLTMDNAGNLYGTTVCQGVNHLGNVFKLTKAGNTWVYSSLYDFTGGTDGEYPISTVTIDTDGTLYGISQGGASRGLGVVWMIKP